MRTGRTAVVRHQTKHDVSLLGFVLLTRWGAAAVLAYDVVDHRRRRPAARAADRVRGDRSRQQFDWRIHIGAPGARFLLKVLFAIVVGAVG